MPTYSVADRLEQFFWSASGFVSTWLPVAYLAVMAGLAISLTRKRPIPGVLWLAIGYCTSLITRLISRIANEVVFPPYTLRTEDGWEIPQWYKVLGGVLGLVNLACYVILAYGFWKLCGYLVHAASPSPADHADQSNVAG